MKKLEYFKFKKLLAQREKDKKEYIKKTGKEWDVNRNRIEAYIKKNRKLRA